jgi:hypothetical protein
MKMTVVPKRRGNVSNWNGVAETGLWHPNAIDTVVLSPRRTVRKMRVTPFEKEETEKNFGDARHGWEILDQDIECKCSPHQRWLKINARS